LKAVNDSIIGEIKMASGQNAKLVVARQLAMTLISLTSLTAKESTLKVADIVDTWKPAAIHKFNETTEMNLFNDNLSYKVENFADVARLNAAILNSAMKYCWLIQEKAAPVFRLFLGNLEVIQTLLGDLHSKLIPAKDDSEETIQSLKEEAAKLEASREKFIAKVSEFNRKESEKAPYTIANFPPSTMQAGAGVDHPFQWRDIPGHTHDIRFTATWAISREVICPGCHQRPSGPDAYWVCTGRVGQRNHRGQGQMQACPYMLCTACFEKK